MKFFKMAIHLDICILPICLLIAIIMNDYYSLAFPVSWLLFNTFLMYLLDLIVNS